MCRRSIVLLGALGCGAGTLSTSGPAPVHFDVVRLPDGGGGGLLAVDVNGDGAQDLVAANDSVRTYPGDGAGGFRRGAVSAAGENPTGLATADFDEDGRPDLAVANHDTDYVTILLGDGAGAFVAAPGSPLRPGMSPHPHALVVGDVDGDGHVDLLVDDRNDGALVLLAGHGDGRFAAPRRVPVGGDPYRQIWLGDLDGDGVADLLTPNERDVAFLRGDGRGGFEAASGSPFATPAPFAVVAADANGDGLADIVTAPDERIDGVGVLLGDGRGGFTAAPWAPVRGVTGPALVATGDLDGDGVDEVVVAAWASPRISILWHGGEGAATTEEVGGHPWSLVVRDLDGDGIPDLAVGAEGTEDVTVLLTRRE